VEYVVSLETGSEALFLLGKNYAGLGRNQSFFDPAQSSTAQLVGDYEGFSGALNVSGTAYIDRVTVSEKNGCWRKDLKFRLLPILANGCFQIFSEITYTQRFGGKKRHRTKHFMFKYSCRSRGRRRRSLLALPGDARRRVGIELVGGRELEGDH
jgi:hypothetical protein